MGKTSCTAFKTCFKCGVEKPMSDYYSHPQMADGHLNKCKECTKSDVRKNRIENIGYYQHYDKRRASNDDRKQRCRMYSKTTNGKASHARSLKKYILKYPSKNKAHYAVSNAIRDGKLKRNSACEACGIECRTEAHHHDYSKPLDVHWLCKACHVEWHKHFKPSYPEDLEAA